MTVRRPIPTLMWVTDRKQSTLPLAEVARLAVAGGVDGVQIREKDLELPELLRLTATVIEAVDGRATVIVNSSVKVARELGVGLHLPEAAPFPAGIALPVVGRSVHSASAAANAGGVDYLIAGHVFETGSKAGLPPIEPSGLQRITTATSLPVLAIGGITPANASRALRAGAHGLAVMSGIGRAVDPEAAAVAFRAAIDDFHATCRVEMER